ncbi:MAG: PDZ domain-containing protein [Alphaproteobacteria bacterium]|nr:PDZ domain-containing protein [Alphaproteobacteria bacterium]MBT7942255.1 PDZ domain-containing protein [Alphaproteobacteria bacterium]
MKCIGFKLPVGFAAVALMVAVLAAPASTLGAETGFIGMQVQGMSPKIAKALGLKSTNGVLVRDVALGGASNKAGFKRGDLILEFGGKKIESFEAMVKAAGATKPGLKVKVAILRAGKPMTLSLTLGKWTPSWRITKSAVASQPASGLTLASLTQKLRKGFGLRWGSIGVVVTLVDPDRTDIGLRRGDLIIQVNQVDVWLPEQVVAAYNEAKKAGRKELLLLVERVNGFRFMALPVR